MIVTPYLLTIIYNNHIIFVQPPSCPFRAASSGSATAGAKPPSSPTAVESRPEKKKLGRKFGAKKAVVQSVGKIWKMRISPWFQWK